MEDNRLIKKSNFFNFNHYNYGEAYFGSYKGMRYRLARNPLKNVIFIPIDQRGEAHLEASVWSEPYAYAMTDKDKITTKEFEFTQDGFDKAIDWINEQYESRISEWKEEHSILD